MEFFSSGWNDCGNILIPMESTLDDLSKCQRRKLFLLDRFVYATLGVGHPMNSIQKHEFLQHMTNIERIIVISCFIRVSAFELRTMLEHILRHRFRIGKRMREEWEKKEDVKISKCLLLGRWAIISRKCDVFKLTKMNGEKWKEKQERERKLSFLSEETIWIFHWRFTEFIEMNQRWAKQFFNFNNPANNWLDWVFLLNSVEDKELDFVGQK
jgi:hypothetical protein